MKKIYLIAVVLAIILSACAPAATPEPPPPMPPTPVVPTLATHTPVPPPTETPLPPTATLEPSPTPDPLLFKDDFEGALGEGWQWVNEDKKGWSLTNQPGWLEIQAWAGHLGEGNLNNVLLRQAPEGNFELETRMKFKPIGDFQIAGLLIFESAANFTQFGRAFCDYPQCARDGYYFDMTSGGNFTGENFATAAPVTDTVYLRLRMEGDTYTAYASEDGKEWKVIGAHRSEMRPQFVGLLAGQSLSAAIPAQFDYFLINTLP